MKSFFLFAALLSVPALAAEAEKALVEQAEPQLDRARSEAIASKNDARIEEMKAALQLLQARRPEVERYGVITERESVKQAPAEGSI